ncbi:MAG: ABC transporter permease [Armatimonadetes bacterium]|nr:ABC transporter permease [Armatimonadota bacterium]
MQRFLVHRFLQMGVILVGLSIMIFSLLALTPGDPVDLIAASDPNIRPEDVKALREYYGVDDPIHVRYLKWLRATLKGDLGYSRTYGQPVARIIGERIANTAWLLGASFLIGFSIGIPIGIHSALHQYSRSDYVATVFSFGGLAMPVFWQGIIFILLFAVWLPIFPAGGFTQPGYQGWWVWDRLRHLVLPALVLGTHGWASWTRYMRSSMLEVLRQDYVRTARAKGVPEPSVINSHALRNALIPIITLLALSFPGLVSGAVITETVFSWPGMGLLLYQAILGHDYNVAMAALLFHALLVVMFNLMADIAYAIVDPRVRYS